MCDNGLQGSVRRTNDGDPAERDLRAEGVARGGRCACDGDLREQGEATVERSQLRDIPGGKFARVLRFEG